MNNIFNSPIELGLRLVFLFNEIYPTKVDLYTLPYLDYAIIYSDDLNGPESLHTPVPLRGGEYLSRLELIEKGLRLMVKRGLIEIYTSDQGFLYFAGENSHSLVDLINCKYTKLLKERCNWLKKYIDDYGIQAIKDCIDSNGINWGAQLINKE